MRFIYFLLLMLICSTSHAQVIYGDTPDQRKTGVYKADVVIMTQAETGEVIIKPVVEETDKDISITSCVQMDDDSPCVESDYFKATIKDVSNATM
jgi:hypothetical protein